jgi:hypothetical protein
VHVLGAQSVLYTAAWKRSWLESCVNRDFSLFLRARRQRRKEMQLQKIDRNYEQLLYRAGTAVGRENREQSKWTVASSRWKNRDQQSVIKASNGKLL